MRMIKFRAKRVNGGEWVKSMTISYGTIKRKMYNVFFEVEPNKWVGVIPETVCFYGYKCAKHGSSSHYRRNWNLFFIDRTERAF